MKLLAFAASNSKQSINKQLVRYAAGLIEGIETELLDINDFEMPIYSIDREQRDGIPELAHTFFNKIGQADAILISYAEHNGSYTAAYKNLFDWMSRINPKVYQDRPMVILSTSPGAGGASNVLAMAKNSAPHFKADLKAAVSVPSFYDNFDVKAGAITNDSINAELLEALSLLS